MHDDIENGLKGAHAIGLTKLDSDNRTIFSYNKRIYRTSMQRGKPKTRLICNVLAELISIDNKGTEDCPAHEYLFKVQANHYDHTEKRYFKPKNLTSPRTFTTKLMGMVPFGKFCGNQDDFSQFFISEVDRLHTKQHSR
ncbi:hypothetical protein [Idiomarina ramblicola]|uniref:Uncharacterized protein n=1 Tax=Idiomarina ramblicola TaxID=263724 RepID=A0A432Z5V8_9GAMM|nr:hypothetical protein [Idiomarina ramblicola]RUO73298.1 hypothetical protein CWI78_02290 [Idiomarina ramblicola]